MAAHNVNNINAQNGRNHLIHNRGERFIRPAGVPFRSATTPQSVPQELAAKCQNFLDTLVRLADNKGQNVGIKVRELVSQLINEELQPEDFGALISSTVIGSRPQPGLVPFLQKSLPCLRRMRAISNQQPRINGPPTLVDTSRTSQNILPSGYSGRLPGDGIRHNVPASSQPLPNIHSTSNAVSINTNRPQSRESNHATQLISSSTSVSLQPRASLPGMTLGHNYFRSSGGQGNTSAVLVPAQVTAGDNNIRLRAVPHKVVQIARTSSPQLSSSVPMVRDDEPVLEDINDVTSQTGVNINEEASYLTEDNLLPVQQLPKAPQRQPHIITSNSLLSSKISSIAAKHQLEEQIPSDVVSLVSQACQLYLKNLIEKFGVAAQHRSELLCHETRYEKESEVKSQLKFFQQIEIAENQRRKEIEREMLMKTAKSRSKNEDPDEQQRAKRKVKELEMAQTERMTTSQTNAAAIHALDDATGPPRKRMLRDLPDGGVGPLGLENSGSPFSSPLSLSNGGPSWLNTTDGTRRPTSSWVPRKVVTLRDAVLVLEQEKTVSSSLLYSSLLDL